MIFSDMSKKIAIHSDHWRREDQIVFFKMNREKKKKKSLALLKLNGQKVHIKMYIVGAAGILS